MVPGDDKPDPELSALGNVAEEDSQRLWQYLRQGGLDNARQLFRCIGSRWLGRDEAWQEPQALPRVCLYHPQHSPATLADWRAHWQPDAPVAALLFYRNHVQSANTAFVDTFCQHLFGQGLNPLPIAVASLKEPACLDQVQAWLDDTDAALIINTTGFALSNPEAPQARVFRRDIPVLQALSLIHI